MYWTSYKLNVGIDIFIWHSKMICIHFLVLILKFPIFKNSILDEILFLGLISPTFTLQTSTYSKNNSKCHILKSWTIKNFRELWILMGVFCFCFKYVFNALKYIHIKKCESMSACKTRFKFLLSKYRSKHNHTMHNYHG